MKTTYHWPEYLIEAWALGMFMLSALLFTDLLEYPGSPVYAAIQSPFARRAVVGIAMGLTAIALIYSPWGKRSGAHINPAVTLTHWQLNRIRGRDAIMYILAQFAGAVLGVWSYKVIAPTDIAHPGVNYVATVPGPAGLLPAFLGEMLISLTLISVVLRLSNHARYAPYTGYVAGLLVALFITFEAPFSGMSMNPARSFGSAIVGNIWTGWWIYLTAPVLGMLLGGYLYRWQYRLDNGGDCSGIKCHLSGEQHDNEVYEVLYFPNGELPPDKPDGALATAATAP